MLFRSADSARQGHLGPPRICQTLESACRNASAKTRLVYEDMPPCGLVKYCAYKQDLCAVLLVRRSPMTLWHNVRRSHCYIVRFIPSSLGYHQERQMPSPFPRVLRQRGCHSSIFSDMRIREGRKSLHCRSPRLSGWIRFPWSFCFARAARPSCPSEGTYSTRSWARGLCSARKGCVGDKFGYGRRSLALLR